MLSQFQTLENWNEPLVASSAPSSLSSSATPRPTSPVISKLDLLEKRRKARSLGLQTSYFGDSSGDELPDPSTKLWITKGPPEPIKATPSKIRFLAMFGLKTIAESNGKSSINNNFSV